MMFKQGAFQLDPNMTPDQVARKREMIAALLPKFGSAKYVGEGIGQLATGVLAGRRMRQLDKIEGAGTASANSLFERIFGTANSAQSPAVQGPLSVLGMTPDQGGGPVAEAPPTDPNSPGSIAGDAMAALGKQVYTPGDKDSFVQAMMPHAMKVSEMTGLDPRIVIAQAAQETGWGKHAPGNNFFGIKSHGKGGGNTFATNEVIDGKTVRINDSFRGYDSMGDSVMGYAEFLQENPRYKEMLAAGDLDGQIAALGRSGYATDPNYASSVRNIAMGIGLPEGFAPGQSNVTTPGTAAAAPTSAPTIPISELYMALQNPWLSGEQKGLITSMIQEQQAASDPMRQLELEKAQLELAQMKNPTAQTPEELTTRMALAKAANLEPGTPEYQTYLLTGKLPDSAGSGGTEYGLTPQYGTDKDGNLVAIQFAKDGTSIATPLPEGVALSKGIEKLDLGTHYQYVNSITGEKIGEPVPKNLGAAEEEKAAGKARGETTGAAAAALPGTSSMASLVDQQIQDLKNDPYLPSMLGPLDSRLPNVSEDAARVQSRIDQLQGGAFLQARQMLKGGGAITDFEGQKAERAFARMNAAQSVEDFTAALDEFNAAVQEGVRKLEAQAAGGASPAAASPAASGSTAAPVAITSDAEYDALPSGTMFKGPDGKVRRKP